MRQLFLFIVLLSICSCYRKKAMQNSTIVSEKTVLTAINISDGCFKYSDTSDTLRGKVLLHLCASGDCGTFVWASLTILETINNDTIRVLQLCNACMNKDVLKKNENVTFFAQKRPNFSPILPVVKVIDGVKKKYDVDPEDCRFKTYYGILKKIQ